MYIIAGLGNPGSRYEFTRHNVGFLAIDELSKKLNIKVNRIKFKGLIGEGLINNEKIILIKPETYMNRSGESIRDIMNFYKVPIENLIVLVDDIDIPFGSLKIKSKGSSGTHNGLKSIIYQLQDDNFKRVKIGVGAQDKGEDLADYVLKGFTEKEYEEISGTIKDASSAIVEIILNGIEKAMTKYNKRIKIERD